MKLLDGRLGYATSSLSKNFCLLHCKSAHIREADENESVRGGDYLTIEQCEVNMYLIHEA